MRRSGFLRRKRWTTLASCLFLALTLGALSCADREARARAELARSIDAEIERLAAVASAVDREALPESLAEALGSYVESLDAVRGDGAPELRLYELREPFVGIETLAFLAPRAEAVDSVESLEALGGPLEERFELTVTTTDGSLCNALLEAAATRSNRLFHASLRYGQIASPGSGLYYLSQAVGNRQFFDFLAGLEGSETQHSVPDRRRLLAVAAEIESAALDWLERDPTNRELIPVSVRLEEAREMLDAERSAGATLLLLEAQRELSRRAGMATPGGVTEAPQPSSDGSAGSLRSLLAAMGSKDDGDGDDESAKIARAELLPLYESMLVVPGGPDDDPRRSVTLTLVRWPYT